MNLNELEITVGNHDNMELRGFNLSTETTAGAEGSSELAQSLRDRVLAASIGAPDPIDGEIREHYGFHLEVLHFGVQGRWADEKEVPSQGGGHDFPPRDPQ